MMYRHHKWHSILRPEANLWGFLTKYCGPGKCMKREGVHTACVSCGGGGSAR